MIFINSVIMFLTKIYSDNSFTKLYLKNDDYISRIINKNNNSTRQLFNNMDSSNKNYYYDTKEHIFKKNMNNSIDGFDMRENITTNNISIYNISVFFYKKNLLDLLNNENININNKLSYIEEYNKIFSENKFYNLHAGGLMKDWDFLIEN